MRRIILLLVVSIAVSACVPTYRLIQPETQAVAKRQFSVTPNAAWNQVPRSPQDIAQEERWTRNGTILDAVTFIGGVESGDAIAKQRQKEDRQVPMFQANMTPPERVAMIESYYRIRAGVTIFQTTNVQPVSFLGVPGMQVDYDYIGGDDVKRRGRSVLSVMDDKLYLMALDGTSLHYFNAALPEFEAMVTSAVIR